MSQATESGGEARPRGERPGTASDVEPSLVPLSGWHFLHLYYRVDRAGLAGLSQDARARGRAEVIGALDRGNASGVEQMQCFTTVGHKADFGLVAAGPDLRAIQDVQNRLQASTLGPVLVPCYSFYSITEVSEYVPDVERYGRTLVEREGMDPEGAAYQTKVKQYAARLGMMNRQRLYPEFPDWPMLCFYPMSKSRLEGQNWYMLPFEERNAMMADHGKSGMHFAGKVSQVITASTGLDDWEWGVTLWVTNPSHLKDIVYTMRFDRASAQYALFGPFYPGFLAPPEDVVRTIRI
jgi:chlorite dismutase